MIGKPDKISLVEHPLEFAGEVLRVFGAHPE